MKSAPAILALAATSLFGVSCNQLAFLKPGSKTGGYADTDSASYNTYGQNAATQGGYYGSGAAYDQAQVYPQQTQTQAQSQSSSPYGQTYQQAAAPVYQNPAPAYTPPAPAPAYDAGAASYAAGGGGQSYTVQKGDTLYKIAKNHGTSVENIMTANGLNSNLIHPGDTLSIR